MLHQRVRGLVVALLATVAACGAGDDPAPAPAPSPEATLERWVANPLVRRAALESSLVTTENAYARLRLAKYDEAGWGALPELNPPTAPLTLDAAPDDTREAWSTIDATQEDLVALGERAFYNYPAQLVTTIPKALATADHAGMWVREGRTGAVWARMPDGRIVSAYTCATCHASVDADGRLVAGRNNADLDVGRLAGDGERGPAWPRGTADVTGDGVDDPVAITDLRPIRFQANLHHAATLRNDPAALAVRIETLIITSLNQSVRPPRRIVAGLAAYLLSLGESRGAGTEPRVPSATSVEAERGRDLFVRECASCHRGDQTAGAPLLLDQVGTDPLVGQSIDRGTGRYRVPSLRFVGDRRRLFAGGQIEDASDLLTPSPGREAKGHSFGLALADADRASLLHYLRDL